MTLSRKTFLIIALTTVLLIGLLFSVTWTLLHRNFLTFEQESVTQTIEQINNMVASEHDNLAMTAINWGAWDDSYEFIADLNETYITQNMKIDVFEPLRVDVVLYLNADDNVVYGRSFNFKTRQVSTIPEELLNYVSTEKPFSDKVLTSTIGGVLPLPKGPLLIAATPIVKTDLSGTARGRILMGRYLNADEESYLSEILGRPVNIMPYEKDSEEFTSLIPGTITVKPMSSKTIVGYELISDINGNPAVVLKTYLQRDLYAQGRRTVFYFMGFTAAAGLIYAGIVLLLLHRLIISRLVQLRAYVKRVGDYGYGTGKLNLRGNDEITELAKATENTLSKLDQCQRSQKK